MRFNTNSESQSRTMLFASLAGVVADVVVGLAIAPKSGSKLRADVGGGVDDYMDSTGQKAEELRKSAASLAHRGLKELWKTNRYGSFASRAAESVGRQFGFMC
jgi:gas vesicle protein